MPVMESIQDRVNSLSVDEKKLLWLKVVQLIKEKNQSLNQPKNTSKRLVAYLTTDKKVEIQDVLKKLKGQVPDYMVPSKVVLLEQFPMLPNGKVNRKELALTKAQPQSLDEAKEDSIEWKSKKEELLSQIWKDVLSLDRIKRTDNFFDIGGDSILSIQVIAQARKIDIPLGPKELFEYQTIASLAEFLEGKEQETELEKTSGEFKHLVKVRSSGSKAPLICLHSGGTHFFFYNLFAKHLKPDRPIYVLQASPHEGDLILHRTVNEMAKDFISELRKVKPHGPYYFVSYCFNTAIGLEITRLLEKESETAHLIIADTMADYLSLFAASKTKVRAEAFFGRLVKNPVRTVRRFVKSKFIEPTRERLKRMKVSGSEKIVQKLHLNHIEIYKGYAWQPVSGPIHLLLTEKKDPEFNDKVIESWKQMTKTEVVVQPTEGHHDRLFLDSNIEETTSKVDAILDKIESN
ncbi:MAG: hypothetical protein CML04_11625 [Pseudozobellia sp.]|nr:hypothetical protein [Pseudozobellia sp.]MBG50350.1 hypothetical protein [Pseudozobellia sp.]MBG50520.1 hypothetical protein [Pseudozobellia sp.]|tara:strand:- start:68684 stop:70069 length:1386 start_codon:yes stop_codon:yes gene_type:complete